MNNFPTNGNNSITIDCVACQQRFSVKAPKRVVINTPTFSTMTVIHEKMIICPKCGQAFCLMIGEVQNAWGVKPLSDEERRQIEGTSLISI